MRIRRKLGCTGTYSSGPPPVPPYSNGYSTSFDGVNEHLVWDAGLNALMDGTGPFSLSIWVKPGGTKTQSIFDSMDSADGYRGFLLGTSVANLYVQMIFGAGGGGNQGLRTYGAVLTNDVWQHFVVTFDGTTSGGTSLSLYKNGALLVPVTTAGGPTSSTALSPRTLRIGGETGAGNGYFLGKMDEPSFWSKALTLAEVQEIYNGGVPGDLAAHSAAGSLTSWLRNGDAADTIASFLDRAGTYDATPVNMASGNIVADVP